MSFIYIFLTTCNVSHIYIFYSTISKFNIIRYSYIYIYIYTSYTHIFMYVSPAHQSAIKVISIINNIPILKSVNSPFV